MLTDEQMVRVDARPVISTGTVVAKLHAIRDGPPGQQPDHPRRQHRFAPIADTPITIYQSACPDPAATGALVDELPDAIFNRDRSTHVSHRAPPATPWRAVVSGLQACRPER